MGRSDASALDRVTGTWYQAAPRLPMFVLTEGWGMIRAVAVLQLVVSKQADGAESLSAVPNDTQEPPYTFDRDDTYALQIGSQGLVELALRLRDHGYRVTDLTLVDHAFSTLDDLFANAIKNELLSRMRDGEEEAVTRFVERDMPGFYVLNLELRDTSPGNGRVTLVQDGIVLTSSPNQIDKFASMVRRALNYGHGG